MQKLVIGFVVAACSIASAEPALDATRAIAPPPAPADYYVSLGTAIGVSDAVDGRYGGGEIDGAYRLTDSLWVRARFDRLAQLEDGAIDQGWMIARPFSDVLTGLEWRGCSGDVCVDGGFDVGYRFGDVNKAVVTMPRIGLDIGSGRVRFRPTLEANVGRRTSGGLAPALPELGIGLTTALAYQW